MAAVPLPPSSFGFDGLLSNLLFNDVTLNVTWSSADGDVGSVTVG